MTSICRVFSCVVGRGFCYEQCVLFAKLLGCAQLHLVFQGQNCLLLQVSLDFLLLHSSPLWWKGLLFWVLVLEGLVDLHRTIQFQHFQYSWLGHRLGLLWYWMICLGNNRDHFWDCTQVVHFRLTVDCECYSIYSKGFLPTVVDIMVIWVKFTHSSPF